MRTLLLILLLSTPGLAQRVTETNKVPLHSLVPIPTFHTTLGFFTETGVGERGFDIGAGAYERFDIGRHLIALLDTKVSWDGQDNYFRVRGGLGVREKSFYVLAVAPQFHQRNFREFSTPFGIDMGLDRRFWSLVVNCDIYRDRPVFFVRARWKLQVYRK